jgi:hypothetical protein
VKVQIRRPYLTKCLRSYGGLGAELPSPSRLPDCSIIFAGRLGSLIGESNGNFFRCYFSSLG